MWNLAPPPCQISLARQILGNFQPKNRNICQKISKVANFFAPQGRIPRPILVKFMCYMWVTCLRNVLKSGAIWFINDKFVGTKLRWVIFPPNFRSPLALKLLVGHKKSRWAQKWYGHALSTCQIWWRCAAARRRQRNKRVFFVCLFVCLLCLRSVYLWAIGTLTVTAILLPFIGRFWCSFQRF